MKDHLYSFMYASVFHHTLLEAPPNEGKRASYGHETPPPMIPPASQPLIDPAENTRVGNKT